MHRTKHLYITGIATGAIVGFLSALAAYGMIQFVAKGGSLAVLFVVTTLCGALIGWVVAFAMHQGTK